MNQNKAPLALMGQLLMVLFFALAAAICLQAFAKSEAISKHSEARDQAVLYAQNAAETLKSTRGDFEAAASMLGGTAAGDTWTVGYDALTVRAKKAESQKGFGSAVISVTDADGSTLFSLTCAWQEAGE